MCVCVCVLKCLKKDGKVVTGQCVMTLCNLSISHAMWFSQFEIAALAFL